MRLRCFLFGCRFPLETTWRWVKKPNGYGYALRLGARARRRERKRSLICTYCGRKKQK